MKKIDLSIIIINYNTRNLLFECLSAVFITVKKASQYQFEIIVVDNASSDGSLEMVKQEFPKVKIIKNNKNFGYAKGNNLGIQAAKGRFILLLNSDTKILPKTLKIMISYMENNPQVGVATCRVEYPDGRLDPACHRGFPTPWNALCYFIGLEKVFPKSRIFSGYHLGWENLKIDHEIDTPTGAFYLVRREVLEKIGLLDEDYFMYAEDIDLSYRIKKAGWKIMYLPEAKIIHYKKRSGREKDEMGKITKEAKKIRAQTINYFFKTMKIFYNKHYQNQYPIMVRLSVIGMIWFLTRYKLLINRLK